MGSALPPLIPARDAAFEATLQRLQRWTTAGRFVLADDNGSLRAEVHTANLGAPIDALVWSASQAAAMVGTAARHLARTDGGPAAAFEEPR